MEKPKKPCAGQLRQAAPRSIRAEDSKERRAIDSRCKRALAEKSRFQNGGRSSRDKGSRDNSDGNRGKYCLPLRPADDFISAARVRARENGAVIY